MLLKKNLRSQPDFPINHQKFFSLSCSERVSDVYLITLNNYKHCNTAHAFDFELKKKQGNFQGFEVVAE